MKNNTVSDGPIAYLLCGISASGKTTLARRLQAEGAVLLSVDEEMWNSYGSGFTELPSEEQRRLTLATEENLRHRMALLLKEGEDIVVDSCLCKRFKRDAFREAAIEAGATPKLIYLTAPKEELLRRLSSREGKAHDDIIVTAEQLERFLQNFQPPQADEEIWPIPVTSAVNKVK